MSTPERERVVAELREAMQRSTLYTVLLHHTTASKAGLNVSDAQCLNALALDGPQTPGRLAQLMGITTGGAITAVIDRLEKAGYVRRSRDPDDRRRVIVELVPESAERYARYFEPVSEEFGAYLAGFSDAQLRALSAYMRHSNATMPGIIDRVRRMP
ncbi:MarR family winged helix-turn-helix transcriptional regulator [Actinomadura sp. 21ATH]|uniref:MarR family winged helix-turn-helix transcriptional regulator n=1 Tax=Actinomadura sp. 21ATH TaxID=1735444 RepID=UPI0035C1FB37